ncbi:hypothetical protein J4405_05875 [Candidatus Woesearchaeota archaeon]|nr:hypothetical protein [Candidatus Woesearchaeota archaeon]
MDIVKALLKVFFGLLLMLVGIFFYGYYKWWDSFLILLKGSIPAVVILIGLVFLLVGFSDMKSD